MLQTLKANDGCPTFMLCILPIMICKKDIEGLTRCKYEPPWLVPDKLCCKACRGLPKHHHTPPLLSKKGQLGTEAQGEFRGPFLLASHAACSFPGREMQGKCRGGCRVSFVDKVQGVQRIKDMYGPLDM